MKDLALPIEHGGQLHEHAQPAQHDQDQEHRYAANIPQPQKGAVRPVEHLREDMMIDHPVSLGRRLAPAFDRSIGPTLDPWCIMHWKPGLCS